MLTFSAHKFSSQTDLIAIGASFFLCHGFNRNRVFWLKVYDIIEQWSYCRQLIIAQCKEKFLGLDMARADTPSHPVRYRRGILRRKSCSRTSSWPVPLGRRWLPRFCCPGDVGNRLGRCGWIGTLWSTLTLRDSPSASVSSRQLTVGLLRNLQSSASRNGRHF